LAFHVQTAPHIVMRPIARADIELLHRVLQYAPDSEVHTLIGGALDRVGGAPAGTVQWGDISPAHAKLLFEEVVWLRFHFAAEEQPAIDRILARLAAVKKGPARPPA
jgi:hypothetical protein